MQAPRWLSICVKGSAGWNWSVSGAVQSVVVQALIDRHNSRGRLLTFFALVDVSSSPVHSPQAKICYSLGVT